MFQRKHKILHERKDRSLKCKIKHERKDRVVLLAA
jgi:hypothetical protein